jgi:Ser/Thr protein kinase RdoA (MazF antagonist)
VHAAETLLAVGLERLQIDEKELLGRISTDPAKQALAWLLKKHTTVTAAWLADRLSMEHRVNASRAISAFDRARSRRIRSLKNVMLQCTG